MPIQRRADCTTLITCFQMSLEDDFGSMVVVSSSCCVCVVCTMIPRHHNVDIDILHERIITSSL